MIPKLRPPRNPELLARVVAALRVAGGQRSPKNQLERRINEAIAGQKIDPGAIQRVLANFDSRPKKSRERFLGNLADPAFVPPAGIRPTTLPPVMTTIPGSGLTGGSKLHGRLSEILAKDPTATPMPIYTARYQGLFCEKESTWDRGSNSDEVYLITSAVTPVGDNPVRTIVHPVQAGGNGVYQDVDTDDERVGPVAAVWEGNADPVSLTVFVMEHDEGDPNAYRDEIDAVVKAAIAILVAEFPGLTWLPGLQSVITDAINWLFDTGDDLISAETVVLPRAMLELYAGVRQRFVIGSKRQQVIKNGFLIGFETVPVVTNVMYHFTTVHNGGGATYVAAFDIVRDPPLPIEDIFL